MIDGKYEPPSQRANTLKAAKDYSKNKQSSKQRASLQESKILDHPQLVDLEPATRAAIHCLAWPVCRRASLALPQYRCSADNKTIAYSKIRWSVKRVVHDAVVQPSKKQKKVLMDKVENELPDVATHNDDNMTLVVCCLNFRNTVADYMVSYAGGNEQVTAVLKGVMSYRTTVRTSP